MQDFNEYALEGEAREDDAEDEGVKDDTLSMRSESATPTADVKLKMKERVKVPVKYIENKTRRHVTFAKRRLGIMKKAYELSVLTGANILLLILSRTGLVYTFTTPKLEPIVRDDEGKNLIRACLEASTAEQGQTSPGQPAQPVLPQ